MTATLWDMIRIAGAPSGRWLYGADGQVRIDALASGILPAAVADRLRNRSVLLATSEQFATALALIACDGLARRIILCPPGLSPEHLNAIATLSDVDAVLCDDATAGNPLPGIEAFALQTIPATVHEDGPIAASTVTNRNGKGPSTEWVLPTSGTSGAPKLVIHTLQTLIGAMAGGSLGTGAVWSTFYDIRRYGGLQIFLRAMIGGGSMVLSSADESTSAFLARAGGLGVTHISGTPSHWRGALMSPSDDTFAPRYVRLSGEIADQAILDRLQATFPDAAVSHAFASTEAGVAFDVTDGRAGFPARLVGSEDGVAMRVEDGSLRIKSDRTAVRYLGDGSFPLRDPDGFVDTGDMVELRQDRYHFIGRRSGIINVGGLKIHPEEVEAVIAEHAQVRMCVVKARRNPITGAIVAAEIVADFGGIELPPAKAKALEDEIISLCQRRLARHKVPASIRFVANLDIAISGKMRR